MQRQALLALALLLVAAVAVPAAAASLTVSADKDTYSPGETVVITVVVEDNATSATVAVTVHDPEGTLVYSDQLTVQLVNGTGSTSTSFVLPGDAKEGNWVVKAQYGSVSAEDVFLVGGSGNGGSGGFGGGNVVVGAAFIAMAFIALAISLNKSKSPQTGRKR
ncbi:hypothetical protein Pyrde_1896 [Pyrodictium delaneyi]|uniref:Macroglobulin domain-containing protein n=1 Tax=Pyrodictium delaneyi TaxID=1273541 RepID=A0A0P0N5A9_9CREN|nr:MG2 domain-containing protein [Pyrodictium delaneyi]ALL01939.1 hypothetical protein Pyrde_1896 [Pyrodictium delaneyi]